LTENSRSRLRSSAIERERIDRGDERVDDGQRAPDKAARDEEAKPPLAIRRKQEHRARREDEDGVDRAIRVANDADREVAPEDPGLEHVEQRDREPDNDPPEPRQAKRRQHHRRDGKHHDGAEVQALVARLVQRRVEHRDDDEEESQE
jgi:hypothetical protein